MIFAKIFFGLTSLLLSVSSFGQTASYHDHNIYHGAGTAFANTSAQAQAVGDGGVLRAQLIWNITAGQTKGADLDLHVKLPNGVGPYTVTKFDSDGVLPGTSQKNPPFGNPNTTVDGNQQVNWVNRQVVFSNGQSVASLDQDNRKGVPNSPSGALVENVYIKGVTAANPNNIPSGTYQFAVHNYNESKPADPQADYALWITTNGRVGVRSEGHYRGTGQDPANPGLPVYVGSLQREGQSSQIYQIDIVNPDHDPHAPGVTVVDAKHRYLDAWHAEQARIQEAKQQAELHHQAMATKSPQQVERRIDWGGCPPPSVCAPSFSGATSAMARANVDPFASFQKPRTIDATLKAVEVTPPPQINLVKDVTSSIRINNVPIYKYGVTIQCAETDNNCIISRNKAIDALAKSNGDASVAHNDLRLQRTENGGGIDTENDRALRNAEHYMYARYDHQLLMPFFTIGWALKAKYFGNSYPDMYRQETNFGIYGNTDGYLNSK